MATQLPHTGPVGPDTLITVKITIDGTNRRFKLALRDLGAHVLPQKLRFLLVIPAEQEVIFERFSDSAATFVTLDSTNPAVYKQLYRAAKAKLKLRMRATVIHPAEEEEENTSSKQEQEDTAYEETKASPSQPRQSSYLETVLSHVPPSAEMPPPLKSALKASHYVYPAITEHTEEKADPLSRPTLPTLDDFACRTFSIDCNFCGKSVVNEHYHCSICENGDYDLCLNCVNAGVACEGEDHWMIKRYFKSGRVFPSTTQTLPSKEAKDTSMEKHIPKLSAPNVPHVPVPEVDERTCNSCISQFSPDAFVTCMDCPDFDLCVQCFEHGGHGHHPAHAFEPVVGHSHLLSVATRELCQPGRGLHHDACCDGCSKRIIGVRNKCMACPDFDYCSTCIKEAKTTHPGHRFAPLYEQLASISHNMREVAIHRGISCDGPACATRPHRSWIVGDRYKCAVCDDVDFCANCEALPTASHNKTHPLIKMKTPIRNVHVSTINEDVQATRPTYLGDSRPSFQHASTETIRPVSTHAATQVQTMAEVKPTEAETPRAVEPKKKLDGGKDLQAWFESDSTPDGTSFAPGRFVCQSWTLRNPGPQAWPAGCAVHYIGGDDMRNLDTRHPSSVSSMVTANRSNVLEERVEPGKTATFTVMLKSPQREGRAISYWRLKTPEGQPFGHKLWVDITVVQKPIITDEKPSESEPVKEEEPATVESQDSSTMIFPKLEKESPECSVHEVPKSPSVATATTTVAASEDNELAEDLENLDIDDEDEDESFLTDEEYDILDADDEDFLEAAQRVVAPK